ncbi:MAG TPA: DUF6599 family protein [Dissulfurispiraceae bacterium]|nr:DUF6599 family protein [Dissulfurispiraceae bacterium]
MVAKDSYVIRCSFVCLVTAAFCLCASFAFAEQPERVLLPAACPDGWKLEPPASTYSKDNLFDYINGEAELYFPFGFRQLLTGRYSDGRRELVVDVYEMGSPLDAFGIYANYRRRDDAPIPIGAGGSLSSSQMLFFKERFYIRLQASGASELPEETFKRCADQVAYRLPGSNVQPSELALVQTAVHVPRSERYIPQSLLGYSFFRRGLISDATVNNAEMQMFVVLDASRADAERTLQSYKDYLKQSGGTFTLLRNGEMVSGEDPLYGDIAAGLSGRYTIGVIRAKSRENALKLYEILDKHIRGMKDQSN